MIVVIAGGVVSATVRENKRKQTKQPNFSRSLEPLQSKLSPNGSFPIWNFFGLFQIAERPKKTTRVLIRIVVGSAA